MRTRGEAVMSVLAMSLAGCMSSVPPVSLHPSGPISKGPKVDFSGAYCFVNNSNNVHEYNMNVKSIPFLDLDAAPSGSEILVRHNGGESISFSFTGGDGREVVSEIKLKGTKAHWSAGKLIVPPPPRYEGARMGVASSREESTVYRMRDGRLVLSSISAEAGLAFLVVPFRERSEVVVELIPKSVDRGCPGA